MFMNVNAEKWHLHRSTKYYVSQSNGSFKEAKSNCSSMQAELVMIKTKDIQLFLTNLIASSYSQGIVF